MFNLKNKNLEISNHILVCLVLLVLPIAFSWGAEERWKLMFFLFWLQIFLLGVIFYVNYIVLIDRFYTKNKVLFFVLNFILIVAVLLFKDYLFRSLGPVNDFGQPKMKRFKRGPGGGNMRYFMDFLIFTIPVVLSIAINFGRKIKQAEVMKKEADNIKLKSELQHLKYQLQPHFFFNSLNNIYSLIDFAPEKAKQSVHSLSKLMRHLLYKTDVDKINLSEEIEFLNKYIELMSLRLTDKTEVITNFPKHVPNIKVAPLLFISIVENAFKHGVSATQHSDINFKMEVLDDEIFFTASNSNFPKTDSDKSGSGIGIENLRKSLNLLYPNKHEFYSHLDGEIYITEMRIKTN